ncbi:MAG: hypothetical protein AB1Z67_00285 [Candidatus Limnocylindrales bacterium]
MTTDDQRPSLVQAGWAIYSRDGELIGEALGADSDRFLVMATDGSERRLEIPVELVLEEEPGEMRARISLDEQEVGADHDEITSIPRTRE